MKYQGTIIKTQSDKVWEIKPKLNELGYLDTEFCCDKMQEAFEEHFIGFGEADSFLNKSKSFSVYKCSPYPEGACWEEMAISYCPFCGEKIENEFDEKIKE